MLKYTNTDSRQQQTSRHQLGLKKIEKAFSDFDKWSIVVDEKWMRQHFTDATYSSWENKRQQQFHIDFQPKKLKMEVKVPQQRHKVTECCERSSALWVVEFYTTKLLDLIHIRRFQEYFNHIIFLLAVPPYNFCNFDTKMV